MLVAVYEVGLGFLGIANLHPTTVTSTRTQLVHHKNASAEFEAHSQPPQDVQVVTLGGRQWVLDAIDEASRHSEVMLWVAEREVTLPWSSGVKFKTLGTFDYIKDAESK
jgi:hypothetical protein